MKLSIVGFILSLLSVLLGFLLISIGFSTLKGDSGIGEVLAFAILIVLLGGGTVTLAIVATLLNFLSSIRRSDSKSKVMLLLSSLSYTTLLVYLVYVLAYIRSTIYFVVIAMVTSIFFISNRIIFLVRILRE